ncbi:MAG TPA: hypothetical protein VD908_06975 [Cytophagales bacterium]|nr:hypothetical protein [Cytophagales bacterium]
MENNTVENDFIKMTIVDGILIGTYKTKYIIDLEAAKKIVADRKILCNGISFPTIGLIEGVTTVTREARSFFGTEEGVIYMKSLAIIVGAPISRAIGNFFLILNRPKVPTKIFNSVEEAKAWSNNYK